MKLVSTTTQTLWTLPLTELLDFCPTPSFLDAQEQGLGPTKKLRSALIRRYRQDQETAVHTTQNFCSIGEYPSNDLGCDVYSENYLRDSVDQSKLIKKMDQSISGLSIGPVDSCREGTRYLIRGEGSTLFPDHDSNQHPVRYDEPSDLRADMEVDYRLVDSFINRSNYRETGVEDSSRVYQKSCRTGNEELIEVHEATSTVFFRHLNDEDVENPLSFTQQKALERMEDGTNSSKYHIQPSSESTLPNKKPKAEYPNCQVCGDESNGFNCGAYVCEACKKFFVRSAKNKEKFYVCQNSEKQGMCEINKDNRTQCPACRYKTCLEVGMLPPGQNLIDVTKIDSLKCKVCGAPASGFHFGTLSCEGCRGFFRRLMKNHREKELVCVKEGSCHVSSESRLSCRACRYKKCVAAGMSLDATRVGRQPNSVRHKRIVQNKDSAIAMDPLLIPKCEDFGGADLSHPNASQNSIVSTTDSITAAVISKEPLVSRTSAVIADDTDEDLSRFRDLPYLEYSHSLTRFSPYSINNFFVDLEILKREYQPLEEKVCQLVESNENKAASLKKEDMLQVGLSNFRAMLCYQVEFLKKLPGFSDMIMDDKIAITKHSPFKNLVLLTTYTYDLDTDCYRYFFFRASTKHSIWLQEVFPHFATIKHHFASCGKLAKSLNLNSEEYALLTVLNCFDPSFISEIKDQSYFLTLHNKYMSLLAFYTKEKYRDPAERMAQLVSILAACDEARRHHDECAYQYIQKSSNLHAQDQSEINFMAEMFKEMYATS